MAIVYSVPEEIKRPEIEEGEYFASEKEYDRYIDDIVKFCKKRSNHPMAGRIVRDQIADGYAIYVCYDGKSIIHVDILDEYRSQLIEMMNGTQLKNLADQYDKFKKIFGK